eukprot:scaffold497_cov97-Cylindrotheca_fusiformis.AAC.7
MRPRIPASTFAICFYCVGGTPTEELSLNSLRHNNEIISVSANLIRAHHDGVKPKESLLNVEQQMAHLGKMLGNQIGREVVSQSTPLVIITQDLDTLSFPSASFILAQLYNGKDASEADDRIWITKYSPHWQNQLLSSSAKSDASSQWIIQSVELSDGNEEGEKFCNGMPMVMAMGGFQWTLGRHADDDKPDCLNYFVPAWKLGSSGRFFGAMFCSFLLGILTEGITKLTLWIRPRLGTGQLRTFVLPLLYGAQQWLGYMVMMVAMMFSYELFASSLVGLMVGRVLFLPKSLAADTCNGECGGCEGIALLDGQSYLQLTRLDPSTSPREEGPLLECCNSAAAPCRPRERPSLGCYDATYSKQSPPRKKEPLDCCKIASAEQSPSLNKKKPSSDCRKNASAEQSPSPSKKKPPLDCCKNTNAEQSPPRKKPPPSLECCNHDSSFAGRRNSTIVGVQDDDDDDCGDNEALLGTFC